MPKFVVSATVDDASLNKDAEFTWRIIEGGDRYTIDKDGGVSIKPGLTPCVGDKFTVEVSYRCKAGYVTKKTKTFTVKK